MKQKGENLTTIDSYSSTDKIKLQGAIMIKYKIVYSLMIINSNYETFMRNLGFVQRPQKSFMNLKISKLELPFFFGLFLIALV